MNVADIDLEQLAYQANQFTPYINLIVGKVQALQAAAARFAEAGWDQSFARLEGGDFTAASGSETIQSAVLSATEHVAVRVLGLRVVEGSDTAGDLSALTISVGTSGTSVTSLLAAKSVVAAAEDDIHPSEGGIVILAPGDTLSFAATATGDTLDDVPDGIWDVIYEYRVVTMPALPAAE